MRRSYRGSAAVVRAAGGYNQRLRRISPSIDPFGKDPLEISRHNTIDMSSSATCSTGGSTTTASQRSLDFNAFGSTVSISEDQAPSIPASFDEVIVDTTRTSNIYTKTTPKKSVSFHQVSIREYPRTIGDNPEVGLGCPIGLSWEYHELATKDVDAYESSRGQRKSSTQMRLHPTTRHRMMLAAGASKEEIKAATKEAAKVQRRRVCTANLDFLPLWTRTELLLQSQAKTEAPKLAITTVATQATSFSTILAHSHVTLYLIFIYATCCAALRNTKISLHIYQEY